MILEGINIVGWIAVFLFFGFLIVPLLYGVLDNISGLSLPSQISIIKDLSNFVKNNMWLILLGIFGIIILIYITHANPIIKE